MSKKSKRKGKTVTVAGARVTTPNGTVAITEGDTTSVRSQVDQALTTARRGGSMIDSTRQDKLPYDVARQIIGAANGLKVDPDKVPALTDDEVTRLITENPDIALEGLTRLGRVLPVPHSPDDAAFNALDLKARMVDDMRRGRIDSATDKKFPGFIESTVQHVRDAVLIDVQSVYDRWMSLGKGNDLYEMILSPPWPNAVLLYNNDAGNVWAMHMIGSDIREAGWAETRGDTKENLLEELQWQPQPPADHVIEWDRVRWVYSVQVYVGGMGQHGKDGRALSGPVSVPTLGPLMIWRVAVYDDGTAADMHWSHIVPEVPMHKFNNALGVLTETLNMCNCVNVSVAYPDRPMPRPQRRRLDRMGVRFSEIHIKPASKSYQGKGQALSDMSTALHGVRGHYATYGKDGRGLLFGKYSGRFWIPPHIRGSKENGEVVQSYVTEG